MKQLEPLLGIDLTTITSQTPVPICHLFYINVITYYLAKSLKPFWWIR